ncbi:hypothetical protein ACWCOV_36930 [Kribbella sp. NPDC002412]
MSREQHDIAELLGKPEYVRVLEIGPGTAQATRPMVERDRSFRAGGVPSVRTRSDRCDVAVPRCAVVVLGSSGLDNRAA